MRSIGYLPTEPAAQRFGEILEMRDIEHQIERDEQGRSEVWILDDDDLPRGRELLSLFSTDPAHPDVQVDPDLLKEKRREKKHSAKSEGGFQHVDARTRVFGQGGAGTSAVTIFLIGISAAAFILSYLDNARDLLSWLYYSYPGDRSFAALRNLEVWRLVTPIFLHFGILHFLFNMLWLRELGSTIETISGSRYLLLVVLVFAILSNTAQYVVSGMNFGGMSGVVYGLLGYVWMRSRYEPGSRYFLREQAAVVLLVWYFICVFGLVGRIANVAHGVGLVAGMLWGLKQARMPRNLAYLALRNKRDRWVFLVLILALPLAWFADR